MVLFSTLFLLEQGLYVFSKHYLHLHYFLHKKYPAFLAQDDEEAQKEGPDAPQPPRKRKRQRVTTTPRRVLFFRSRGELMNHPFGGWPQAGKQLHTLALAEEALPVDGAELEGVVPRRHGRHFITVETCGRFLCFCGY